MYKFIGFIGFLFCLNFIQGQTSDSVFLASFQKDTIQTYAPDSILFYEWNSTNLSWENGTKDIFEYSTEGLKTQQINYQWYNDEWVPGNYTNYTYSNKLLAHSEFYVWDDYEIDWVPANKYSYSYNDQKNVSGILDSKWDISLKAWLKDSLFSYNYTESGYLSSKYVQIWSNLYNEWENNSEVLFNYYAGSNTRQVFSFWDFDYLIWIPRSILYINYDTNQIMLNQIQTVISSYRTEWINDWRNDYKWNSNNQIQEITNWIWSMDDSAWIETFKTKYSYNSQKDLTYKVVQYYDAYYLEWLDLFQTVNKYSLTNELVESTLYSWNYAKWNPVYKYNYYYPDYTGIENTQASNFEVFPNPVSDKLNIQFTGNLKGDIEFYLYDIQGKQVLSTQNQKLNSITELSLPDLTNGLYILKAKYLDEIEIKKIVVQH